MSASEFGSTAVLEVEVEEGSLRDARRQVEEELGGVTVSAGGGGGGGGTGDLVRLAEERNDILQEQLDELEDIADATRGQASGRIRPPGGGGGGGIGAGILGLGLAGGVLGIGALAGALTNFDPGQVEVPPIPPLRPPDDLPTLPVEDVDPLPIEDIEPLPIEDIEPLEVEDIPPIEVIFPTDQPAGQPSPDPTPSPGPGPAPDIISPGGRSPSDSPDRPPVPPSGPDRDPSPSPDLPGVPNVPGLPNVPGVPELPNVPQPSLQQIVGGGAAAAGAGILRFASQGPRPSAGAGVPLPLFTEAPGFQARRGGGGNQTAGNRTQPTGAFSGNQTDVNVNVTVDDARRTAEEVSRKVRQEILREIG